MNNLAYLEDLADETIVIIMQDMPLLDLIRLNRVNRRLQGLRDLALSTRTELTLSIGAESEDMSRNSRLWHPYQNDTVAFGGGWYDTLHHGYIGYVNLLEQEHYEWIRDKLPGITRLNIMFDCYNNYSAIEPTIERLISLILQYAPRLVSFRLWACGPVFLFWSTSEWYSVLKNVLIPHIFDALQWMSRLEILWLDLDDIPVEDFPSGMQTSPTWSLEDQLNARVPLLNLCALREFRFASTQTDPYHMIVHRLPQFGALQQIHIAKGGFTHEWVTLQPDFARRFHEIGVIIDQAGIGNGCHLIGQYF